MLPTGCSGDGLIKSAAIREDKVAYTHYLHKEWAEAMLERSQTSSGLPQYQKQLYPLSVWKLGTDLTWVALGGEVTVGYVNRLRSELSDSEAWISAYTNQVQAYIPTQLVMNEGGYEGGDNMISSAHPARYADGLEEVVVAAVRGLAAAAPVAL
jgi:hypothetical protein